jgi:hypothetical protein
MAKTINPSKLLPSSKSKAIVRVGQPKSFNIITKTSPLSKDLLLKRENKDSADANNKLVKVDKFLKSDLIVSQKKAEIKRKDTEKQDFAEAEKKLELPKFKAIKLPGISAPSLGFLDRIKRFIFFTALGWVLPKILEFLPKLEGFAKIIGGVYNFAEGLFGKLFDGFMSLVKFGGDLKDKTLGFIATAKEGVGGNYQKEFDKLEKQFNTFVNASIIAGVLAADIGGAAVDEYNKWRKKNAPKPGKPPAGRPRVTQGRGGQKPTGKPKITGDIQKPPSWWNRIFKGPFAKLKGPLSRFAGAAVPGLGAAVGAADAALRFKAGDKIGGVLASVSAALDTATAAAALTGIGLPVAGILGTISIGIDIVLLIRDILSLIPFIPKNILGFSRGGKIIRKYQGGGTTRGGRPVGAPKRRTITPTGKKLKQIKAPTSQPGRDVGGESKIKRLYPNTGRRFITTQEWRDSGSTLSYNEYLVQERQNEGKKPNPYKALTTTAKILKDIPLVGGIMGAAVDVALGQKPDVNVYRSLSSGIGSLVEGLANQKANKSVTSLMKDIRGFAEGGNISVSRQLKGDYNSIGSRDLIAKVLGPTIEQRVNEAIQSIQKELQKRKEGEVEKLPSPEALDTTPGTVKVTSESPDFWLLVTAALFENGQPTDGYQGAADAAQAIYNRVSLPGWPKSIKDVILQPGQFQPVSDYGGVDAWQKINSKESAIAFAKKYKGYSGNIVEKIAAALLDRTKQEKARTFVGPRDNFRSDSFEKKYDDLDNSTEVSRYGHTFGFEPRGANIGRFKKGKLMPAEVNKQVVSGKVEQLQPSVPSAGYKPKSPGKFNVIQYITGDPSQSGNYDLSGHGLPSNYHDHIAFATEADKERAKAILRKFGIKIGSEYRPGDPGYHGKNLAIDVPGYQWGGSGEIGEKEYKGSSRVREILGLQGGGLIKPSKPNRPIPNSFAPYETYRSGMMIAIQPMIIEKPVSVSGGNGIIAFPVPVGVNNTMNNLSNLSQG